MQGDVVKMKKPKCHFRLEVFYLIKWCSTDLSEGYCYVRGDNHGDRTQYIELLLPELINVQFIEHLQDWLKSYKSEGVWRILLPTYLDDSETIFIYEEKIALGKKYKNMDIDGNK